MLLARQYLVHPIGRGPGAAGSTGLTLTHAQEQARGVDRYDPRLVELLSCSRAGTRDLIAWIEPKTGALAKPGNRAARALDLYVLIVPKHARSVQLTGYALSVSNPLPTTASTWPFSGGRHSLLPERQRWQLKWENSNNK